MFAGVQGNVLSAYVSPNSLGEVHEMCRQIQTLGRMLPEPDDDLMSQISRAVLALTEIHKEKPSGFEVQDSCMMLQCLGRLIPHEELAPLVVRKCKDIIPPLFLSFASQLDLLETIVVADTFYWFGYLGPTCRTVLRDCNSQLAIVVSRLSELIDVMTPIDVGKVTHALAFLKLRDTSLLSRVDNHSAENYGTYGIREASRILWAFGRLNWSNSILFKRVLQCFDDTNFLRSHRSEVFPQYIAHLTWAVGKIGRHESCINMLDQLGQVHALS